MEAKFSFSYCTHFKLYTNALIVSTGEIFERERNFFIHKCFMLSNVIGIQQCDLARSTRTAYGSKHFPLTRKKFALYALKIYIIQDRMKNL